RAAIRSEPWAPAAGGLAAAGTRRTCLVGEHAPHRQRRMVGGDTGAGVRRAVQGLCGGGGIAAAGIKNAVRRRCAVAAGVVAGRGAGRTVEILARAVEWDASPGVADRPWATGDRQSPRREYRGEDTGGVERAVEGDESA